MKKILAIGLLFAISFSGYGQSLMEKMKHKKDSIEKHMKEKEKGNSTPALSNEEVVKGLREALTVGTNNSSGFASKLDGY